LLFFFLAQVPPAFRYVAQPTAMVTAPSTGLDITPTKLYISNLDYNVSNEDIKVASAFSLLPPP
jgi:THO complex subunit 4